MSKHSVIPYVAGLILIFILMMPPSSVLAVEQAPNEKFGHQDVPTRQLTKEHDLTLKVADAAAAVAAQLRSDERVPKQRLIDLHDFFFNFVDACHHGKEEQYYFPVALIAEPGLESLIATLKLHHEIGKSLLSGVDRSIALWDDSPKLARLEASDNMAAYATLLRRHIDIESTQLMNKVEAALSPEQQDVIRSGFHYIEAEVLGEGFHEKYHALALKILEQSES